MGTKTPTTLNNIGLTLARQLKYDDALVHFERALAIHEENLGANHPLVGGSLNNIGVMLKVQGKYEQALAYYHRSLDVKEKSLGPEHRLLATNLENIGSILTTQKKYQEALEAFERTRLLTEKAFGPDHQNVGVNLRSTGNVYCFGIGLPMLSPFSNGRSYCHNLSTQRHSEIVTCSLTSLGLWAS